MKLLLDDKTTRGCNLNANEACIFAAILKCTRAGRGWYGNYRELAAAMPFVMSRQTASRAVDKLLTLGLIEVRENETLFAVQNGHEDVQNGRDNDQNGRESVQNALPPNNPPINNNMNEKEKEQPRALCTHDGESQTPIPFWNDIKLAYKKMGGELPTGAINSIERNAFAAWQLASPAKKIKLLAAVKSGAHFKARLDWLISDFPEPQPVFLRGDETGDIVQVRYNGAYKLCTRATMEMFGLEFVREW